MCSFTVPHKQGIPFGQKHKLFGGGGTNKNMKEETGIHGEVAINRPTFQEKNRGHQQRGSILSKQC